MRNAVDACHSKEPPVASTNSIRRKTKGLMRFHCGCHDNKVTITTRYEAEPIVQMNLHTKQGLNMT